MSTAVQAVYESLIEGLVSQDFAVSEQFLEPEPVAALRANLERHYADRELRPAGIGNQHLLREDHTVRGDAILWLESDSINPAEQAFFQRMREFIDYLNMTCYAGIRGFEFHYALYPVGAFYKRHLDQFRGDQRRKYSFILYLNENWQPADGGQLVLYLDGEQREVLPIGGRCVFFKSDEIEHEVLPAHRARMSVTGWLKI